MKYRFNTPAPAITPTTLEERLKQLITEELKTQDYKTNGDVLLLLERKIRFMGMGSSHLAMISRKDLLVIKRLSGFEKNPTVLEFKPVEDNG
jgi:hypothetical protein